ncbi:hypothetical protein RJ639_007258 [Escallonia herrerae]|uniref:Protein kinase domain-containing protein n=1 Tax=Escallonia herrerae TaxID=1293975 RepID=A0AA88W0H7_9ASTE|nr:hypothetical protein RJ639_007258 [Escallonia herrerae]
MMLRRFRLEELEKATNHFSEDCLIGSGAFGKVYRGTLYAEGTLAIKKARADSYTSTAEFRNGKPQTAQATVGVYEVFCVTDVFDFFEAEVKLLSKVKHRNLVGLVGYCDEAGPKRAQALVYEYVSNGSLLEYIVGRGGRVLTWRQRVNIAIGAAKDHLKYFVGVAHLHEGINPGIIHRDIKPSNILIGEAFEAKVSDFGLVKSGPTGDQSHVSSQIKGTPGYLDPAYCSSFHLSPFSDVYSFGVILLQLVAARPAVDTTRSGSNYHIIEWARPSLERSSVEDILDANLLLEPCNMEMMLKMGQLGLRCVVKVPKQRPTMTQVWQELEASLYSAESFINKQPSRGSRRPTGNSHAYTDHGGRHSTDNDHSHSFVSVDGVGLQRFHIEMDSMSFQSTSMRCLEADTISLDIDKYNLRGIREEPSASMFEYLSIPRD